jgi:hypothetical protein
MGVEKLVDNVAQLVDRVNSLALSDVLVGIPKAKSARNDGPIGNAALGYIHEFGSPAQNIPARPFLYPGVKKAKAQITALFKQGAQDVLTGKGTVDATLHKVGMVARNSVVSAITDPSPPFVPLKPRTVRDRLRKTAAGRRQLKKLKTTSAMQTWAQSGNIKPLIDTGQLRASITYVVKKAGA